MLSQLGVLAVSLFQAILRASADAAQVDICTRRIAVGVAVCWLLQMQFAVLISWPPCQCSCEANNSTRAGLAQEVLLPAIAV